MLSMNNSYHRPRIFKHLRPFVLICSMAVLSLTPVPSHADWRDAIGAAAGSLSEGFSRQAEADRQLEEQKKLLEYQYKLEREKREREYQLENERREQERVEQESRRIAAEEKKKRDGLHAASIPAPGPGGNPGEGESAVNSLSETLAIRPGLVHESSVPFSTGAFSSVG